MIQRFSPDYYSAEMRNRMSDNHPNDPLLIYVGRLGKEKSIQRLRTVLQRNPGYRLILVGGGPEETKLRQYFDGYQVKFMGTLHGNRNSIIISLTF